MHRKVILASVAVGAVFFVVRFLTALGTAAGAGPVQAARLTPAPLAHVTTSPRITATTVIVTQSPAQPGAAAQPESSLRAMPPTTAPSAQPTVPAITPTAFSTPRPVPPTATPGPASASVNELPRETFIRLPDEVRQNIREVWAKGQSLGRNPRSFSKVGDSTMVWPPFLAVFDSPSRYDLGPYAGLSGTVERLAGSLGRESIATRKGMHSWSEFDPTWADPARCGAGEGPLPCEFRLNNPSVAIIRLGANDYNDPAHYDQSVRRIVEFLLYRGVIPVLGTRPDRLDGPDNTLNKIVAQIASDYAIPLWDYDLVAGTVSGKGLLPDGTHFVATNDRDYRLAATFEQADALEDLTGLMMLDAIHEVVAAGQ